MRRALILVALACALVVAGCGGGSGGGGGPTGKPLTKAAYEAKLAQISKDIGKSLGKQSNDISKLTKADIDTFVSAVHNLAKQLQALNPPAEVADLHKQFVQAVNDLADEFPGIAKKLRSTKDPSTAITALFGAKGIQELIKVGDAFKKKGYNISLNG